MLKKPLEKEKKFHCQYVDAVYCIRFIKLLELVFEENCRTLIINCSLSKQSLQTVLSEMSAGKLSSCITPCGITRTKYSQTSAFLLGSLLKTNGAKRLLLIIIKSEEITIKNFEKEIKALKHLIVSILCSILV